MIQNISRHIYRLLAMIPALFMALAFAACGDGAEPADPSVNPGSTRDYSVSVRISAGAQPTSRALPEEFGTIIENTIDLNDLKILVFDENRVLKEIWYDNGVLAANMSLTEVGLGDVVISGKLDDTQYSRASRFSIAALVNWNSLQESEPMSLTIGETKYSDLANMTFLLNNPNTESNTPIESWCPTDDSLVPMYGVLYTALTGYSTSLYNEGNPMNLGTINVLRAVAKIEVIDNASTDKIEVESVELNTRNCRGFLTPDIFDYLDTQQVIKPNIPGSGGTGVAMSPALSKANLRFRKNGNVYVAYVPEMTLAQTIPFREIINVNITYSEVIEPRSIFFAPYNSDGEPTIPATGLTPEWKAILRNHIYRFTLNSITASSELLVTVDVVPYRGCYLDPWFGLERN